MYGCPCTGTADTREGGSCSPRDHFPQPECAHDRSAPRRTLQGGRQRLRNKGQTRCDPSAASQPPNSERKKNPQYSPDEAEPGFRGRRAHVPHGEQAGAHGCRAPCSPVRTALHHTLPTPPPARLPTQMARLSMGSSSSFFKPEPSKYAVY